MKALISRSKGFDNFDSRLQYLWINAVIIDMIPIIFVIMGMSKLRRWRLRRIANNDNPRQMRKQMIPTRIIDLIISENSTLVCFTVQR